MNIQNKIKNWIKETLKLEGDFVLAHPKDIKNGDFAFFLASPKLGAKASAPEEAARILSENQIPEIAKIEVVGNFINFYLSKEFFVKSVEEILNKGEKFGGNDLLKGQKILIDHTQPNPFKEFHIGHLMNNAVGESIKRILAANGAEAIAVGYHGDIGLHVAKTILGIKKSPDRKFPLENDPLETKVVFFGMAYQLGSDLYETTEDSKKEAIEINKSIHNRDDELINRYYDFGRKVSLEYFESIYKKLDSEFEHHFYESETGEVGKKIVLENVGKVFENGEGGAVIFKGENFEPKTHTRVFINSQDIPVYEAKEIGLAKLKRDRYSDYSKSITVTANEQDSFFDVVEVAISEVFSELKGKLLHLSHGMLKLPTGKMSSRAGTIITAGELIERVKDEIKEKIKDREFGNDEKEKISMEVAIGAIKYSILRQAIGGDIIFDFDKSISFEGDSGPYLQYACVRANSVLKKLEAKSLELKVETLEKWEITELERHLYKFEEVVERAGVEYAPHHIVTYLTELASIFNSFYASNKIIDENDPTSPYKIALTQAVAHTLKSGLRLLAIKVPERM